MYFLASSRLVEKSQEIIEIYMVSKLVPTFYFSVSCQHCNNQILKVTEDLVNHSQHCHAAIRPPLKQFKYCCYSCNYHTHHRPNMRRHIRTHIGDKPFTCCYCSYNSNEKVRVDYHLEHVHKITKDSVDITNTSLT
uniref:Transcriptional repressor CTCFL n=1 Tax=Cacopsylla melanoneura TaxID=428564 RepID=A0A8D8T1Y5_9HEMI